MKTKKLLSLLLALCMMFAMLAGCAEEAPEEPDDDNTVTDPAQPTEPTDPAQPTEPTEPTPPTTPTTPVDPPVAPIGPTEPDDDEPTMELVGFWDNPTIEVSLELMVNGVCNFTSDDGGTEVGHYSFNPETGEIEIDNGQIVVIGLFQEISTQFSAGNYSDTDLVLDGFDGTFYPSDQATYGVYRAEDYKTFDAFFDNHDSQISIELSSDGTFGYTDLTAATWGSYTYNSLSGDIIFENDMVYMTGYLNESVMYITIDGVEGYFEHASTPFYYPSDPGDTNAYTFEGTFDNHEAYNSLQIYNDGTFVLGNGDDLQYGNYIYYPDGGELFLMNDFISLDAYYDSNTNMVNIYDMYGIFEYTYSATYFYSSVGADGDNEWDITMGYWVYNGDHTYGDGEIVLEFYNDGNVGWYTRSADDGSVGVIYGDYSFDGQYFVFYANTQGQMLGSLSNNGTMISIDYMEGAFIYVEDETPALIHEYLTQ